MRRARTLLAVPCRVPVPVPPRGRPGFHYADGYAVTLPSGKRVPFMTRRQVRDLCRVAIAGKKLPCRR